MKSRPESDLPCLNRESDKPHGCIDKEQFLKCFINGVFVNSKCLHTDDTVDSDSKTGQPMCPYRRPRAVNRSVWRKNEMLQLRQRR
jgi:hypothetical protein